MNLSIHYFSILLSFGLVLPVMANINPEMHTSAEEAVSLRSDCNQATMQIDLNINNVRSRLLNGGDVWWDLQDGGYIVPNVDPASGLPEVSAIFAGAVWIGGYDDVGNLKMAAQTYRSSTRTDFWPGPLTQQGTTAEDTCLQWDRFFRVLGENIREHIRNFNTARELGQPMECDAIPEDIRGWPGKGNPYFFEINGWTLPFDTQGLGAFHDEDNDGLYDPCQGDYPVIEVRGCDAPNFPDEMIFWIYNDNGNIHTNSQGDPIRMEVQVQAFAYSTNDELNDMTFQRYKLINRATSIIDSCFFAMWIDPDLGCHTDDYIGCDTSRSLMYVYNEDAVDGETGCDCPSFSGPVNTYCQEVPILGVDYFRGPRGPVVFRDTFPLNWVFFEHNNDGPINHFREIVQIFEDSTIQINDTLKYVVGEERVELGMSSFTYYMNGSIGNWPNAMTDPQAGAPQEFYRYISGSWKDGTPFTLGGSGYNVGSTETIDYAFPDVPNNAAGWSMCTADLDFGDRRTLQATGPLRLDPGEVNELIIGAVWVPEIDYPCPDVTRLFSADGIAQALFDNCFIVPDGPDAPDVDIIELDRELILILTNDTVTSNNAFELYAEKGLEIPDLEPDSLYRFEGYKIYQLAGANVGPAEVDDLNRARLIIQVDVKNGVNTLYNWTSIPNPDPLANQEIWIPEVQVEGADQGIRHTFQILEDQFGSEDRRLVNHKQYYFLAVAYAYNNYGQFDPQTVLGQRRTYLEGRRNLETYIGIPRPIVYKNINAFYGEGASVTGLGGVGAGGNFLDITNETREAIAEDHFVDEIDYMPGASPIDVIVYDPLRVVDGEYVLKFFDNDKDDTQLAPDARWELYDVNDMGNPVLSEKTIATLNEQIIDRFGFAVSIGQTDDVGDLADDTNGAIGMTLEYADLDGSIWFGAIPDGPVFFDYVPTDGPDEIFYLLDPTQALSSIDGGLFYPFHLGDYRVGGANLFVSPTWQDAGQNSVRTQPPAELQNLNNVDIVLTSDKSKWSRCIVVETWNRSHQQQTGLTPEGLSNNLEIRDTPNVGQSDNDGDGKADPDGTDMLPNNVNLGTRGWGWFPGYAVDVESGMRLNIFFGENSIYTPELQDQVPPYPANGNDMIWNPTSDVATLQDDNQFPPLSTDLSVGGMHYIYVTHQEYDSCRQIGEELRPNGAIFNKWRSLPFITWAAMPLLLPEEELLSYNDGLIPNEVTIKIRVDNPYAMRKRSVDAEHTIPEYRFSFENVEATDKSGDEEINEALAQINVVPNPYYTFSEYSTTFNDVVKITNLPDQATVTIYSIDGRFIRQYKRSEAGVIQSPPRANPGVPVTQTIPDIEWNLKNSKGIPIASGVYLIHVSAPGLGERTIKWFGVNGKFDAARL